MTKDTVFEKNMEVLEKRDSWQGKFSKTVTVQPQIHTDKHR